jgi:hypothetical protein
LWTIASQEIKSFPQEYSVVTIICRTLRTSRYGYHLVLPIGQPVGADTKYFLFHEENRALTFSYPFSCLCSSLQYGTIQSNRLFQRKKSSSHIYETCFQISRYHERKYRLLLTQPGEMLDNKLLGSAEISLFAMPINTRICMTHGFLLASELRFLRGEIT